MTNFARLRHGLDTKSKTCRVVIETPKGSRSKFDYDAKHKVFLLKTLLPDGMSFPLDFGFVPSTLAEDGDPLDVMVLMDEPLHVGVVRTPVTRQNSTARTQHFAVKTIRAARLSMPARGGVKRSIASQMAIATGAAAAM